MNGSNIEATAPSLLALGEDSRSRDRLVIALDRRVECRIAPGDGGVVVESRDALARWSAPSLEELIASHPDDLVLRVLRASGLSAGFHAVTHARLPGDSGIHTQGSLLLAAAAAALAVRGGDATGDSACTLLWGHTTADWREREGVLVAAVRGGLQRVRPDGSRIARQWLPVDPGMVEERLTLVDLGAVTATSDATPADANVETADVERAWDGLARGSLDGFDSIVQRDWEARRPRLSEEDAARSRWAAGVAREHGAAGTVRGRGRGLLLVLWHPPGGGANEPRGRVLGALKARGGRRVSARVDLRGLEVEAGDPIIRGSHEPESTHEP
jgi:hypothetical protein